MTQKQFVNAINRHGVNKIEILDSYGAELKYTLNNGKNIYSQTQGDRDGDLEFYYESEVERSKRLKPKKRKKNNSQVFGGIFNELQLLTPSYHKGLVERYGNNKEIVCFVSLVDKTVSDAQANHFSHFEKQKQE